MPFTVSVTADLRALNRSIDSFTKKQLPFATALALTAIAKRAQAAETLALSSVFDEPTPFTKKAISVIPARKATQTATIFVKDRQAKYFAPYEFGGKQVLNGRALLNPKNVRLNQYGNLPKATLARLKAQGDVFIGPVKTAHGTVNGVWQRVKPKRGRPGHLKLLIRFGDGVEVKQHLDYRNRAMAIIRGSFRREMGVAIARALATAKKA